MVGAYSENNVPSLAGLRLDHAAVGDDRRIEKMRDYGMKQSVAIRAIYGRLVFSVQSYAMAGDGDSEVGSVGLTFDFDLVQNATELAPR